MEGDITLGVSGHQKGVMAEVLSGRSRGTVNPYEGISGMEGEVNFGVPGRQSRDRAEDLDPSDEMSVEKLYAHFISHGSKIAGYSQRAVEIRNGITIR